MACLIMAWNVKSRCHMSSLPGTLGLAHSYNRVLYPRIMMTSSNGSIFRVTGPLWGNSPVTGEFPSQRPVTRSFDVFFDLRLIKRLRKQSRRRWFETPMRSLWRHIVLNSVCLHIPRSCTSQYHRTIHLSGTGVSSYMLSGCQNYRDNTIHIADHVPGRRSRIHRAPPPLED